MFLPFDGISIPVTPTLDTGAYATGDLLFAPIKLTNATLNTKGMAIIRSIVLLDSANQKAAIDLIFFDADPGSLGALNAAVDMPAAALAKLIGVLSIVAGNYATMKGSTNAIGIQTPNLMLPAAVSSKDFWLAGIIRGTATYGASDLTIKAIVERQG